jgi:hypothetical protein
MLYADFGDGDLDVLLVATTTEALAKGLGRTAGGKRPAAPSPNPA